MPNRTRADSPALASAPERPVTAPPASNGIIAFASRLAASRWRQHLLFALATAVTVVVIGYHAGTGDQSIYLPFLAT